jgi:3-oxoacyl-[acyl-carrier protein] reductase
MDLGISGRRAAVAAGSAGLGFGAAQALAEEGVQVALCGRDQAKAEAAADRIGHGAVALVADVGDTDQASGFVTEAAERLGGTIDILVANAGGPPPGTFASTDLAALRHAVELNLLSTVAMCQTAVPAMQAQGWGRVVAITSIGVRQPPEALLASSTARTGLSAFLKILAREVAEDGVTVNQAQPGLHDTDRVRQLHGDGPLGRVGDPADFGAVVAFLCSEQARFVTGTGVLVDGGAFPGLP